MNLLLHVAFKILIAINFVISCAFCLMRYDHMNIFRENSTYFCTSLIALSSTSLISLPRYYIIYLIKSQAIRIDFATNNAPYFSHVILNACNKITRILIFLKFIPENALNKRSLFTHQCTLLWNEEFGQNGPNCQH